MVAKLCLLTCVLAAGQLGDRGNWLLVPQFVEGQELIYRGSFTEEALGTGVQFQRVYRLESHILIMAAEANSWKAAFLTTFSPRQDRAEGEPQSPTVPTSVRLEVLRIERQGHLRGEPGIDLAPPLEGPPTLECGSIVEVPLTRVGLEQYWEVQDPGRPPRIWRVAGTEVVSSTTCVKLVGEQESPDWDLTRARADSTAWRRRDTIWLAPTAGIAYRVERIIERREPAHAQPTQRSIVRYEFDGRSTYPPQLLDDRRYEVEQARRFFEDSLPLIQQPALYAAQVDALLHKIAYYLERNDKATPYRCAVEQVRHRLEAAKRGEVIPNPVSVSETTEPGPLTRGQRAPDFVVTDLIGRDTVRLYRLLGRPILLIFYNPATEPGRQVLRFAQVLSEQHPGQLKILALTMTDDSSLACRQHTEMHLPFPLADGRGLHVIFGVDGTPRLVVLDGQGVLHGAYTGWGSHTATEVLDDLRHCQP